MWKGILIPVLPDSVIPSIYSPGCCRYPLALQGPILPVWLSGLSIDYSSIDAGISIGTVYISRDSLGVFHWDTISSLTYSILFIVTQVSEFSILGVYTNDSYTGSTYISISGLHLIHVYYGILMVGVSSGTGYSIDITPIDTIPMDIYSIMDYSY